MEGVSRAGEEELRERVAAISIDTQGETLIVTDGENRPLRPAIVWLDNRADAQAKAIDAHFGRERGSMRSPVSPR